MTENRRHLRKDIEVFCPATFNLHGKTIVGYIMDISQSGAKLKIYDAHNDISLPLNEEVHYRLYTGFGISECDAVTIWTRRDPDAFLWGIQFTNMPQNLKDPLRKTINEPLPL